MENTLYGNLFDFATSNDLALAPLQPNSKQPFADPNYHPTRFHSWDTADFVTWHKGGCNIAVPAAPNNIVVVDIDPRNGGSESWDRLCVKHRQQYEIAWMTRSGGAHVLFDALGIAELNNRKPNEFPGIDIICKGYAVCPPSIVDGKPYSLPCAGHIPTIHPLPKWLAEMCQKTVAANTVPSPESMRVLEELLKGLAPNIRAKLDKASPKGKRSDAIASVGSDLISAGFSDVEIVTLLIAHPVGDKFEKNHGRALADVARMRSKGFGGSNSGACLEDFAAYMPAHTYIFKPTREMWPGASVNSRIAPIPLLKPDGTPVLNKNDEQVMQAASVWLDKHQPVEQMTWAPGKPMEIKGQLIAEGGWIDRAGCTVFNLYRPPTIRPTPGDAKPWVDHIENVYEDDATHIIQWLAHRVQRPQDKINHALVLGGNQGIGKDTLLEPVKHAVGPWNFAEVSPVQMLGRFNGFFKSVILRISEARDLGDTDRFAFYDHMKAYTAAPPDVLRVDEKHLREHAIVNVCGIIITTNHKGDGIYLPADDRRHYVAWSSRTKDDFQPIYWNTLYQWFANGGCEIVAHYLAHLDMSGFDPKAPPHKTQAFWEIVDASRAPEDAEMADALDKLGRPNATTLTSIACNATSDFRRWLDDHSNRRRIPHRLDECGYVPVRNDAAKDGLWKIGGRRVSIYAKCELTIRDRIAAAERLASPLRPPS